MATRLQEKKADLLERVVDRLHDQLAESQAERAETFLRHYYRAVSAVDLIERDPLDLYGAALSHLRLADQRAAGAATLRVYNPQIEQHGWQSTHTVVEVVTDDMPFLVDSMSMALNRLGLLIHITIHPVVPVKRDAEGRLTAVLESGDADGGEARFESFMHFEIDRQSDPERIEAIRDDVERVLADVRAAVEDWRPMLAKVDTAIEDLRSGGKLIEETERAEAEAFLRWTSDHHFTLLGYACYDLIRDKAGDQLQRVEGSALGLLRRQASGTKVSRSFAALPPELRRQARDPAALIITKANTRSTVHRPVYLDYIGVRRFDAKGKVIGEHRFLGLFTSAAYNRNPRDIPLLRHKVTRMIERAQLSPTSHSGKALANILDTYPRDELFQTSDDELFETVQEILHLHERQTIHLFLRRDAFARFVSCMVYVPRERYNTEIRRKFQDILQEALNGTEVEFQAQVSESALARIQFIVRTPEGIPDGVERGEIESRLVEAARSWGDVLLDSLIDAHGEEEGNRLFRAYGGAIPVAYQEQVPARAAVPDVERIDQIAKGETELAMSLSRPLEHGGDMLRFKLMRAGHGIPLSDVLPVLENMGLRVLHERPSEFVTASGSTYWLHDFRVQPTDACELDPDEIGQAFQDMFARVWRGEAENDGLNELVLHAGLGWREVEVLRTCCRYLLQVGIPFSQAYMEQTLVQNAELSGRLATLFAARFDPDLKGDRAELLARLEAEFRAGLDHVANLDQDRILRRFMRLILATLRTNFYQQGEGGAPNKPYLSIKIDPAAVPEMPLPRPAFEIFVYSPRMEGVHLRGGKVARGGIRWSDRREDFRTEVLGLMKAQMVKNGVIVPVGAKGGFVVKRPPRGADRAALQAEVVHCYQTLMRGMLDITDNRVGDRIVIPPQVVRFDDDDPYLVVAADKGTATFSDIANQISIDYGHWLGDAFASGGSAGYDHKGMGITARGAWESVKRLFLELGKDIQSEPFTAVGIGDMSGDVFGNGMLLSEQTRLVAAFDHRHIFIDPDPDPATSFAERKRLFELPRSSWDDYERARISAGGGVFPRTVKSIKLSQEARHALDVEAEEFTPHELIKAILLAPVELFWNGGIGTYVKAAEERHADAFDRTNDAVRVDAEQLRCRVIGEGGNLGLTQRARIAFSKKGRINTDFIDNSAGVDCSDHEVNIKILLGAVVDAGDMTIKQRDRLLAEMTDEVGQLVLRNNILQVQAISVAEARPSELLDSQAAFMRRLEASGRLNRELEVLPDEETLAERRQLGQGLFRPEVAVLVAYAKMALYDELLASDLPDDPYLLGNLIKYFPRPLRKRFREQIAAHRLRREIIATLVANSLVNRGLGEFIGELSELTGRSPAAVARSYVVARDAFGLVPLFGELERLGKVVGADYQMRLLGEARIAIARGTEWFLRHCPGGLDMGAAVERFGSGIASLLDQLDAVLPEIERDHFAAAAGEHQEHGVEPALARRLAGLPYLFPACEVIAVADQVGTEAASAGRTYFGLDAQLHLGRLRGLMDRSSPRNHWERIALAGLYEDLAEEHRRLTIQAFASDLIRPHVDGGTEAVQEAVGNWLTSEVAGFSRWQRLLSELDTQSGADLAMIAVAIRALAVLDAAPARAA